MKLSVCVCVCEDSPQDRIKDLVGGRGLGRACDHINHFGHHIKEIVLWKAWGAAIEKAWGEHCVCVYV